MERSGMPISALKHIACIHPILLFASPSWYSLLSNQLRMKILREENLVLKVVNPCGPCLQWLNTEQPTLRYSNCSISSIRQAKSICVISKITQSTVFMVWWQSENQHLLLDDKLKWPRNQGHAWHLGQTLQFDATCDSCFFSNFKMRNSAHFLLHFSDLKIINKYFNLLSKRFVINK